MPGPDHGPESGSPVGDHAADGRAAEERAGARERAAALARGLARQEVRVSVALDLLERAEWDAAASIDGLTASTRRLAAAGGVPVVAWPDAPDPDAGPLHPAVVEAEQIVRVRAAELERTARRVRRPRHRGEIAVVGTVSFALFAVVGALLAARAGVLPGDAVSRVQNAQAVVFGRDPHPEAIGFVWGPFPTAFQVPVVLLRSWWPDLTSSAVAAVLVSAAFMAGTLVQLVGWGRDAGSPRWFRWSVVVVAVAHPLVWMYGANGMSEACGMFFLVVAARQLARWLESDDVRPLMACGLALGLAYLTRYEALTAILAVGLVVAAVSTGRQPRAWSGRERVRGVTVDVTVVALPALAAVIGWAAVSWVIIGEPFAQFSSEYGNSALVRASANGAADIVGDLSGPGRAWFFLRQLTVAAPLLIGLVLVVLWLGDRAATRAVAALAVLGAPVALQLLLATSGSTFPWFRYVGGAVALSVLLVLVIGGSAADHRHWLRPVALLALVPGVVVSTAVVRSGDLGSADDAALLRGVSAVLDGTTPSDRSSITARAQQVAADIDRRRDVVPGAVLTDTSSTFAVVAASPRPEAYLIPSDRDFEAVVADPATFGVRYLLLHGPATPGDAIVREYPRLWANAGAPVARLVQRWGSAGDRTGEYRLYAVDHPAPRTRPSPEDGFTP